MPATGILSLQFPTCWIARSTGSRPAATISRIASHTLAWSCFSALHQLTGALWRSAFVAAVFAIHPLRVESVAWIAERKDVLSGVLFMLTLLAYARYVSGERSLLRYLLVAFLFGLGLMAKPMLVTLPCVLLLLDYWPLRRFGSHSPENDATPARPAPLLPSLCRKDSSLFPEPRFLTPDLAGPACRDAINHRDPARAPR